MPKLVFRSPQRGGEGAKECTPNDECHYWRGETLAARDLSERCISARQLLEISPSLGSARDLSETSHERETSYITKPFQKPTGLGMCLYVPAPSAVRVLHRIDSEKKNGNRPQNGEGGCFYFSRIVLYGKPIGCTLLCFLLLTVAQEFMFFVAAACTPSFAGKTTFFCISFQLRLLGGQIFANTRPIDHPSRPL